MTDQQWNIFSPITQARDMNADDIETVKQVFTESVCVHQLL